MFIYMSAADAKQRNFVIQEAKNCDERVSLFKDGCFDKCRDNRITFRGHGTVVFTNKEVRYSFGGASSCSSQGGITSEEFVKKLIEYKLPSCVKKIDLIGCNIGLKQDKYKLNFPEQVLKLLHNHPQYRDIEIRAFCYVSNNYVNLLIKRSSTTIRLLSKESLYLYTLKTALNSLKSKLKRSNSSLEIVKKEMLKDESLIKEFEECYQCEKEHESKPDLYDMFKNSKDEIKKYTDNIVNYNKKISEINPDELEKDEKHTKYLVFKVNQDQDSLVIENQQKSVKTARDYLDSDDEYVVKLKNIVHSPPNSNEFMQQLASSASLKKQDDAIAENDAHKNEQFKQ